MDCGPPARTEIERRPDVQRVELQALSRDLKQCPRQWPRLNTIYSRPVDHCLKGHDEPIRDHPQEAWRPYGNRAAPSGGFPSAASEVPVNIGEGVLNSYGEFWHSFHRRRRVVVGTFIALAILRQPCP